VHVVIGRKSFEVEALVENYAVVLEEILRVKPASAKGRYIHSIALATDHGSPASRSTRAAPATCSRSARRSLRSSESARLQEEVHQPTP